MPGLGRSPRWWKVYEALRREGKSKSSAARIASAVTKLRKK